MRKPSLGPARRSKPCVHASREAVLDRAVALEEFEDAAGWYESQRPGLGDEFIAEVDRTLARVEHEEQFATVPVATMPGRVIRREFVHRFPYVVFFVETPDSRRVIMIRRENTDPALWRSRL